MASSQISPLSQFIDFSNIAILLVAPVILFLLLGIWLDNHFHTTPIFLILGVILGFTGSIITIFRRINA